MTTRRRRTTRWMATLAAAGLVASCGGSDDAASETPDPSATTLAPVDDDENPAAPEPEPEADAAPEPEPEPESEPEPEPAPEPEPEPEPEPFDLATLPAVIEGAVDATDALATAQLVLGFPLEIPIDGATEITELGADIRLVDDDGSIVLRHDVDYAAATAIGDVDINLDDNGPGSEEIIEIYDPIMTDLGYERNASTASDPGDPGGPNSVNHVYVPAFETLSANGVTAVPGNVFVWADENLVGVGQSSTDELVAGRRVDVAFDADQAAGLSAVPLLGAVADAVPVPDGAAPIGGELDLRFRPSDSFDIDRGSHYLDVEIEWSAPDGSTFDDLVTWFSDPTVLAPDADPVAGAEASFFNEGEWEPSEGRQFDEGDWRRTVLLSNRYEGEIRVQDRDGQLVIVSVFTLDAVAPELTAPE